MNKQYVYKYFENEEYIGTILNVTSEPEFTSEINSAGSELVIEVPTSFQSLEASFLADRVGDEAGNYVVDEQGNNISTTSVLDFPSLPNLYNRIELVEISSYYPTGKTIYIGFVMDIEFDNETDTAVIKAVSYGAQLSNFLVQPKQMDIVVDNNIRTDDVTVYSRFTPTQNRVTKIAQVVNLSVANSFKTIALYLGNAGDVPVPVKLSLKSGTPSSPGTLIAVVTRLLYPGTPDYINFILEKQVDIPASTDYFFMLENLYYSKGIENAITVGYDSAASYSGGAAYYFNDTSGWSSQTKDIQFVISKNQSTINNEYTNYDPTAIATELIDGFNSLGGVVAFGSDTYESTGVVVSYEFRFTNYLDALLKCVELSPPFTYWYIDAGTNTLYYKKRGNTYDHLFVGTSGIVRDFKLKYSLQNVTNKVYLGGGDSGGGTNVLVYSDNKASIEQYGHWMKVTSDNRAETNDVASVLADAIIGQENSPRFTAEMTVLASGYDITLLKPGQIVGYADYNSLVNTLSLQIVSVTYAPDQASVRLEIPPDTQSKRVDSLRRGLIMQESENNPTSV